MGVSEGCDAKVSDCHPEMIPRSRFVNSAARECTYRLDDGRRSSETEQQLRNMEAAHESTHRPPLIGFSNPCSVHQRFDRQVLGLLSFGEVAAGGGLLPPDLRERRGVDERELPFPPFGNENGTTSVPQIPVDHAELSRSALSVLRFRARQEYRRANEFQERPELTIGTQRIAIGQKTVSASKNLAQHMLSALPISIGAACWKVKKGYHDMSVASFSPHRVQKSETGTRRGHGLMKATH
jgi:hypothetical protein